ncbi:GNAT family N-acetyltransferase [Mycetocola miduiensis]|uniref:L-amino acid N-acyltransferase YncA n=1 Tax=Mycetocola miduiensis TaxID=995034 RepID=A0A1I4Z5C3_9MICO|nr:GNAT family N-acetyltransferase [Mycetocola miduiensis]SFN45476.1 L-amino acid N-acyltransferase YncA [Mycetocola miduiensis]
MPIQLRPATTADVDAVVAVFLACWRESYRGVLPDSTIDAMSDEKAQQLWERVMGSGEGEVLVAESAGTVLGVTRLAANGAEGVVHSLYVAPDSQGQGLGQLLLSAAASRLADLGARNASLWVFAANAPSLAFYRRHGWEPDGTQRTQEQFGELELRVVRRLAGASE